MSAMKAEHTRFTLDLDRQLQRRLKIAAALKGVSMREYATEAIERALEETDVEHRSKVKASLEWLDHMRALRDEIFQGKKLSGDSTEIIREMREERTREQEQW